MLRRVRRFHLASSFCFSTRCAFRNVAAVLPQSKLVQQQRRTTSVRLSAKAQPKRGQFKLPPPAQSCAQFLNGKHFPFKLSDDVVEHLKLIGAGTSETNVYLSQSELKHIFGGVVLPEVIPLRLRGSIVRQSFHHTQTNKATEILEFVSHDYIPLTESHCHFRPNDAEVLRQEAKRRGVKSRIWLSSSLFAQWKAIGLRKDAVGVRLPSGYIFYSNEETTDPDFFEKNKHNFAAEKDFRSDFPAASLSGKFLSLHFLDEIIRHAEENNVTLPKSKAEPRAVYVTAEEVWYHFKGKVLCGATPLELPGYRQPLYHFAQTNKVKEILEYVSHDYIPTNPFRGCFKSCDAEFLRKEAKERGISSRIWVARPSLWRFGVDVAKDAKPVQVPSGFFVVSAEETSDPSRFGYFGPAYVGSQHILTIGGFPHEFSVPIQRNPRFIEFSDASPYWMTKKEALAMGTDVREGEEGIQVPCSNGVCAEFFNASQTKNPSLFTARNCALMWICSASRRKFHLFREVIFRRHIIKHNLQGHRNEVEGSRNMHVILTEPELWFVFGGNPLPGAIPVEAPRGMEMSVTKRYHHTQTNKAEEIGEYASQLYIPVRPDAAYSPFSFKPGTAEFLRDIAMRRNFVSRVWMTEPDCVMNDTEVSEGEDFVVTPCGISLINAEQGTNQRQLARNSLRARWNLAEIPKHLAQKNEKDNLSSTKSTDEAWRGLITPISHASKFADGSALIPESQKRAAAHVEKLRSKFPQVFSSLDDICGEKKETIWVSKKQLETIFDYGELLPELANKDEEEVGLRFVGQGHTRSEFITQCVRKQGFFFPHWLTTRRKEIEEYASHDYIPVVLRASARATGEVWTTRDPRVLRDFPQGDEEVTLLLQVVPAHSREVTVVDPGVGRRRHALSWVRDAIYVELLPRETCEQLRVAAMARKLSSRVWISYASASARKIRLPKNRLSEMVQVSGGTLLNLYSMDDAKQAHEVPKERMEEGEEKN